MRNPGTRTLGALCAALLGTIVLTMPVVANGGGEGQADLGLDALTITAATAAPRTGQAVVAGEITCSQDLHDVYVYVSLRQTVGRFNVVDGWADTLLDCSADDGSAAFALDVWGYGKFAPGSALLVAGASVGYCIETEEEFGCFFDEEVIGPTSIRLTH